MSQTLAPLEFMTLERMGTFSQLAARFPEMIQSAPLFRRLDDVEISRLASVMQVYVAREGVVILREGDPGSSMLLIIEGLVKVTAGSPTEPMTLGILDQGKTLGEMSMIDQQPRSATCTALQDCVFATLSHDALEALIENQPTLAAHILREVSLMLSMRLRRSNEKMSEDSGPFLGI
jgi:CRP/FNR family transcriptional regulator, cyclic AMP receptor protein